MSQKRKKQRKVFLRIEMLFLLAVSFFISCGNSKNASSHSIDRLNSCELLSKLNSKDFLASINFDNNQIVQLMSKLFKDTDLHNNMVCGFAGCYYLGFDLDKSLYKLDLIKLKQFYRCLDTFVIENKYKSFSDAELKFIKERAHSKHPIDTTSFLY